MRSAVWGAACLVLLAMSITTAGARPAANVARTVTADDQGHLHIVGGVTASNSQCWKYVNVTVRHLVSGTWTKVGQGKTDGTGYYDIQVADDPGTYQAITPHQTKGSTNCLKAHSARLTHHHP